MKRIGTIFLLALFFGCDTSSNIKPPNKNYFVKYFGGEGNQKAVGLIANDDGTFYILGNSRVSTGAMQQVYLAKATALGDTLWQTTYGNAEMDARDFKVANGFIVVAANRKTNVASTDSKIQLIQFKLNGDTVQSKILQIDPALSASPQSVWANSLTVMKDGGFFVAGYTTYVGNNNFAYDALQIRTDNNFNPALASSGWIYVSGAGVNNYATRAFQVSADSTYVFGYTNGPSPPSNDEDFWAFRLDSKGVQRKTTVFVANNSIDELFDALRATQGGYLLTGLSIDNNSQVFGLKISKMRYDNLSFDSNDNQFSYAGRSLGKGGDSRFTTACNAGDGYFVLTNIFNAGGISDILLLKLDVNLQEMWSDPVTLGGDGDDTAAAVAELPDGHIMVLGTMNLGNPPEQFKIALMKLNSAGKLSD
ncbi:MAG TPA: hypothetical protein VL728_03505 [Cyclobacteriaceae bacterium]|jgi:hypothetical protein|nr:hypothetical protein [Cyclobacteriaceae bacterium]